MTSNGIPQEANNIYRDRRKNRRYALSLALRYKVKRGKRVVEMGRGQTFDMSSAGIRFATSHLLTVGASAELWVDWPVPLDGRELRLMVHGRVVRSDDGTAAVQITRREFRVAARRAGPENQPGEVLRMEPASETGFKAHEMRSLPPS